MAGDVTSPEGDDQKTATVPIASASAADASAPLPTAQPDEGQPLGVEVPSRASAN
jgi:hypothetical protein